jgi:hypothetical protein
MRVIKGIVKEKTLTAALCLSLSTSHLRDRRDRTDVERERQAVSV